MQLVRIATLILSTMSWIVAYGAAIAWSGGLYRGAVVARGLCILAMLWFVLSMGYYTIRLPLLRLRLRRQGGTDYEEVLIKLHGLREPAVHALSSTTRTIRWFVLLAPSLQYLAAACGSVAKFFPIAPFLHYCIMLLCVCALNTALSIIVIAIWGDRLLPIDSTAFDARDDSAAA